MHAFDATTGAWVAYGITNSLGAYNVSLPPGTYKLLIQTNSASYPPYVWNGPLGASFPNATPVTLPPNAVVNITVTGGP